MPARSIGSIDPTRDEVHLTLRLPRPMWQAATDRAHSEDLAVSQWIRRAIRAALENTTSEEK